MPPVAPRVRLYAAPTVPEGSGRAVVIASGSGLITRVAARVAVCAGDPESVTVTVNEADPAAVGVPERTPAVLSAKPAGSVPEVTSQVSAPVPPVATRIRLYAVPTVPGVRGDVVVICNLGGLMTRVAARLAVCAGEPESVTDTVNELLPAVVGVPDKTPPLLNVSPAGRVPEVVLQVSAPVPPVAARVMLYAVFTVPAVNGDVVVIERAAGGGGGVEPLPPPQPANNPKTKTPQRKASLLNRIPDPQRNYPADTHVNTPKIRAIRPSQMSALWLLRTESFHNFSWNVYSFRTTHIERNSD